MARPPHKHRRIHQSIPLCVRLPLWLLNMLRELFGHGTPTLVECLQFYLFLSRFVGSHAQRGNLSLEQIVNFNNVLLNLMQSQVPPSMNDIMTLILTFTTIRSY